MTKHKVEKITKDKMDNFDYVIFKRLCTNKPMQLTLEGKGGNWGKREKSL